MWSDDDDVREEESVLEELRQHWHQNRPRKPPPDVQSHGRPPRYQHGDRHHDNRSHDRRPRNQPGDNQTPDTEGGFLYTVYVGNLPQHLSEVELEELFGGCGQIKQGATFLMNHPPSGGASYGFVRFVTKKDANTAVREFHGSTFQHHTLKVELAKYSRDSRQSRHDTRPSRLTPAHSGHSRQTRESDDDMMMSLIESYTLLLAQPTQEGQSLPDLSKFLGVVQRQTNRRPSPFQDTDYEITANLRDVQTEVVESFAANMTIGKTSAGTSPAIREMRDPVPLPESVQRSETNSDINHDSACDYSSQQYEDHTENVEENIMTEAQPNMEHRNGHIMTTDEADQNYDDFDEWEEEDFGNFPQVLCAGIGRGRHISDHP